MRGVLYYFFTSRGNLNWPYERVVKKGIPSSNLLREPDSTFDLFLYSLIFWARGRGVFERKIVVSEGAPKNLKHCFSSGPQFSLDDSGHKRRIRGSQGSGPMCIFMCKIWRIKYFLFTPLVKVSTPLPPPYFGPCYAYGPASESDSRNKKWQYLPSFENTCKLSMVLTT